MAECCYAEYRLCQMSLMLRVANKLLMLNVLMLSVFMLSNATPNGKECLSLTSPSIPVLCLLVTPRAYN
jgi:hypothetical protein